MHKGRLEAFSDGVFAIIITIMVLELHAPASASFAALRACTPVLCGYVLSFVYVGIYWNNHHHLLQAADHVNGAALWGNLHLLFWLSLVPFVTSWAGQTGFAPLPVASYGVVLLMAGLAYWILGRILIRAHGENSTLAKAVGSDGKGRLSLASYAAAIGLACIWPKIACGVFAAVALLWLVPDARIEKAFSESSE